MDRRRVRSRGLLGVGLLVLLGGLGAGCGDDSSPAEDAGRAGEDAGGRLDAATRTDAAVAMDAAVGADAAMGADAAVGADAATEEDAGASGDGGVDGGGVDGGPCDPGELLCGEVCADPMSDAANCGACGVACVDGASCVAGSCACDAGLSFCDGACVDLAVDEASCGACGVACGAGEVCAGGSCVARESGCADGTREGFVGEASYPAVAACSGGFSQPGTRLATAPLCDHDAGNDADDPSGMGCAAADLCAPGWAICADGGALERRTAGSCGDALGGASDLFFAARATGPGSALCGPTGSNDVFGCGDLGQAANAASCAPLERFLTSSTGGLTGWDLGGSSVSEALNVTKPNAEQGGVLCCVDLAAVGCADGSREGFADLATYPDVASCAGGWDVPGIRQAAPACDRFAGDGGANPDGTGCNVEDLCAPGWHVCDSPADFGASSPDGCAGVVEGASGDYFFTAAVSGPGSGRCGGGSNDIFGCGTLGDPTSIGSCNSLNRFLSSSNDAAPWDLGGGSSSEASAAVKSGPADGGVLCCRD